MLMYFLANILFLNLWHTLELKTLRYINLVPKVKFQPITMLHALQMNVLKIWIMILGQIIIVNICREYFQAKEPSIKDVGFWHSILHVSSLSKLIPSCMHDRVINFGTDTFGNPIFQEVLKH